MAMININLLPFEDVIRQKKEGRFKIIQRISIFLLISLIFLATAGFITLYLQKLNINKIESEAASAEQNVASLKDKEAALFVLKNRLVSINQILKVPGQQADIYEIVVQNLPRSVGIASVGIDKNGNVIQSLVVPDGATLDSILKNYLAKATKIDVESLSRGRDSVYRVNLKIQIK